jgi:hypothetical protein
LPLQLDLQQSEVIHRRTDNLNESHLGALLEDVFAGRTERSF